MDYWSFALIAFEVMTGMRPFLHGESPSQWCVAHKFNPLSALTHDLPFLLAGLLPQLSVNKYLIDRLPLVEEKPRDAICIYRRDDREIEFSKTIPFYTHCTEYVTQ